MSDVTSLTPSSPHQSPFEAIRRTNAAGNEFWSSRDFARVLGYSDYRNFEQVVSKARMACFNSAHRVEDHFVDVTDMVDIGSGAQRPLKTVFLSRYACYLVIQNADPSKEIVALREQSSRTLDRRSNIMVWTTTNVPDCLIRGRHRGGCRHQAIRPNFRTRHAHGGLQRFD